jgi:hypothetical protein
MYVVAPDRSWGYVIVYGALAAMFGVVLLLIGVIHRKLQRDLKDQSATSHGFEVKQETSARSGQDVSRE